MADILKDSLELHAENYKLRGDLNKAKTRIKNLEAAEKELAALRKLNPKLEYIRRLEKEVSVSRQSTAPVAVPDDYFSYLISKARTSADKAMKKFPQPNYVLLKVAEEAGEVVQAGVHYAENRKSWDEVEGEIVQLLAMLIRLVTEGDQINGVIPPESVCNPENGVTNPPDILSLVEGQPAPLQIVAAANKYLYHTTKKLLNESVEASEHEVIICGHRHFDMIMQSQLNALEIAGVDLDRHSHVQGFIDNRGKFHNREDALVIATKAGQINRVRKKSPPDDELFSEDLY